VDARGGGCRAPGQWTQVLVSCVFCYTSHPAGLGVGPCCDVTHKETQSSEDSCSRLRARDFLVSWDKDPGFPGSGPHALSHKGYPQNGGLQGK
jgi:hypothetical protein